MTFKEVSQGYFNVFGKPDQTINLPLNDKMYIQWYWYIPDVVVEFVAPKNDITDGWEISFAICLDPLKYYSKGK
jgi:hypothetical protein